MRLDFHVHTTAYSPCSTMSPDEAAIAAKEAGLDGFCLTEHDRIWKIEDAKALSDKHGIAVFRGIEITTKAGDIVVFGLEEEPTEMWSPELLKEKVDKVGGLAISAHPYRGFLVFGFGSMHMDLEQAKANPTIPHVHALEVCNSMVTDEENETAKKVADELGLLKVGGSDAHKPEAMGTCVMVFEDQLQDERQLIEAVKSGRYSLERAK